MPLTPRRTFSQNFLTNTTAQRNIVKALNTNEQSIIVEIGPGTGALTQHLVHAKARALHIVEYDERCVEVITANFLEHNHVRLHHCDILKFPWETVENAPLHIIGSLPYHITSPIIIHCLQASHLTEAVFVIQKEVAQRLTAPTHSRVYGRISVITQLLTHPEILFDIPPQDFTPQPQVTSCAIKLTPRANAPKWQELTGLEKLTHICFQQRRKQLHNILKGAFPAYIEPLRSLGIAPEARPETLSPETFYALAQKLMQRA